MGAMADPFLKNGGQMNIKNLGKIIPTSLSAFLFLCSFNPQLSLNLPNDRSSFQSYCWQVPKLT